VTQFVLELRRKRDDFCQVCLHIGHITFVEQLGQLTHDLRRGSDSRVPLSSRHLDARQYIQHLSGKLGTRHGTASRAEQIRANPTPVRHIVGHGYTQYKSFLLTRVLRPKHKLSKLNNNLISKLLRVKKLKFGKLIFIRKTQQYLVYTATHGLIFVYKKS